MTPHFFYTTSPSEVDQMKDLGYADNGTAFYVYAAVGSDRVPLWRLYDARSGQHFYTAVERERDEVVDQGLRFEGAACFVERTQMLGTVPVTRVSLPGAPWTYKWTALQSEIDQHLHDGWHDDGWAFFAYLPQTPDTVGLIRMSWDGRASNSPLLVDTGDRAVGGGEYMRSNVSLSSNGKLVLKTHTWCKKKLAGFTGGVVALMLDKQGNVLANTAPKDYGVDGEWILGGASSRETIDVLSVDPSVYKDTTDIDVWLAVDPHNRLETDLNKLVLVGKKLREVADDLGAVFGTGQHVSTPVS
jgi:Repeat of unknown function (DUF5648)